MKALEVYKHCKEELEKIPKEKRDISQEKDISRWSDHIDDITLRLVELKNNDLISRQLAEVLKKKGFDVSNGFAVPAENKTNTPSTNALPVIHADQIPAVIASAAASGNPFAQSALSSITAPPPDIAPEKPQMVTVLQPRKKIAPKPVENK